MKPILIIGLLAFMCKNSIVATDTTSPIHNLQRRDAPDIFNKIQNAGMQLGMNAVTSVLGKYIIQDRLLLLLLIFYYLYIEAKTIVEELFAPSGDSEDEDSKRRRRRDVIDNDNVMKSGSDGTDRSIFKDVVDAAKRMMQSIREIFNGSGSGLDTVDSMIPDDAEMM